ncbi:helix-turn-helix domain-containing protein [Neokomagataea anthophila]|uniref:Helix-turn-helix transcriptional regulator n=1 Tax=Neokomagataea anthophila TaxID=2826925 RepID=A0ABS5E6J6_9PROT|nr:helix-turn-helix transcriptional regulator [Neokomagataea anthophila]MBR0559530.1 helix-turn-helix transcriptional regulator [Neokomagataea anthophila]
MSDMTAFHGRIAERIGAIIRRERLAEDWTQDRLAQETGLTVDNIAGMELGSYMPIWPVLMDVLWALDISTHVCAEIFQVDASVRECGA